MNGHVEEQETLIHCEDGGGRSGVVILAEVLLGMIEHNEVLVFRLCKSFLKQYQF